MIKNSQTLQFEKVATPPSPPTDVEIKHTFNYFKSKMNQDIQTEMDELGIVMPPIMKTAALV